MSAQGHPRRTRVAGIDMGSNTTRLIVADVERDDQGRLRHDVVCRRTTITRLAEQVDRRGILLPQAIARTRNALTSYNRELREHGAVFALATATSAVRDADNGEAFLGEVEHSYGFRAELLSGSDEAQATWSGVVSDPDLAAATASAPGLLLDIGGGSTEVVLSAEGMVADHHSFQLGSVRLTEQLLDPAGDPPASGAIAKARKHALEMLQERFDHPPARGLAVGVAGTVTTVVAVRERMSSYDPSRVHGARISRDDVEAMLDRLGSMSAADRASVTGLEPARAPVILGGLCILASAFDHFGLESMTVSERDILDGIALMAGRIALEEGIIEMPEPFGRTMC